MNNFFFVLPEESGGAPFVGESQTSLLFREREDVFVSRDSSSVSVLSSVRLFFHVYLFSN